MRSTNIIFRTGTAIELSFASIIPGKEAQLFDNYFPKVIPIVDEMGAMSLGSASLSASSATLGEPKMTSFFQWPDRKTFTKLHKDPRFQKIKKVRDETLSLFSNGHFFVVEEDTVVTFEEGEFYGLIAEYHGYYHGYRWSPHTAPLICLQPTDESVDLDFDPARVLIVKWSPELDGLMSQSKKSGDTSLDIFKFTFNFPENS